MKKINKLKTPAQHPPTNTRPFFLPIFTYDILVHTIRTEKSKQNVGNPS